MFQGSLLSAPHAHSPELFVPRNLGYVTESFEGESDQKVILILDAHEAFEGQLNISRLVRHFVQFENIQTVFEEGYEGPLPSDSYFKDVRDADLREKVSLKILDELRMGGAEFAHVNRNGLNFNLIGAESVDEYLKNVKSYRRAVSNREHAMAIVEDLQVRLSRILEMKLPQSLKNWRRLEAAYASGNISIYEKMEGQWSITGRHFPNIANPKKYPYLSALFSEDHAGFSILDDDKSALHLNREFQAIESAFKRKAIAGHTVRRFFEAEKLTLLLKRLLELKVSFEEVQEIESSRKLISKLEGILNQEQEDALSGGVQAALEVYSLARKRDFWAAKNVHRFLKRAGDKRAVLVFGGFHQQNLKNYFQKMGISYDVVIPKINRIYERHQKKYAELMASGASGLGADFFSRGGVKAVSVFLMDDGRQHILDLQTRYQKEKFQQKPARVSHRQSAEKPHQGKRSERRMTKQIKIPWDEVPLEIDWKTFHEDLDIAKKWRGKFEEHPVQYVQAVGDGTYLGIIGHDEALVREMMRYIIFNAYLWNYALHDHLLVEISKSGEEARVYIGKKQVYTQSLKNKINLALSKAKKKIKSLKAADKNKEKLKGVLAQSQFFDEQLSRVTADELNRRTLASAYVHPHVESDETQDSRQSRVVVYGDIKPRDADDLLEEILKFQRDALQGLGHVWLEVLRDRIRIKAENPNPDALAQIESFVRGFRTVIHLSDFHLVTKGRDDLFGEEKEEELIRILDWAIRHRALVVINGDFLDLWKSHYLAVKRAYPKLFEKFSQLRRFIWNVGNHDEDFITEKMIEHREKTLAVAKRNILKEETEKFQKWVSQVRLPPGAKVVLVSGIEAEGIAFDDNVYYVDESIFDLPEASRVGRLQDLIGISNHKLKKQVQSDFPNAKIARYYLDEYRGLSFEHGHAGESGNFRTSFLTRISVKGLVRFFERFGLRWLVLFAVKQWYRVILTIRPDSILKGTRAHVYRVLSLGQGLKEYLLRRGFLIDDLTLFMGHTHLPTHDDGLDPIDQFSTAFTGVRYKNSGAWIYDPVDTFYHPESDVKSWTLIQWNGEKKTLNGADFLSENSGAAADLRAEVGSESVEPGAVEVIRNPSEAIRALSWDWDSTIQSEGAFHEFDGEMIARVIYGDDFTPEHVKWVQDQYVNHPMQVQDWYEWAIAKKNEFHLAGGDELSWEIFEKEVYLPRFIQFGRQALDEGRLPATPGVEALLKRLSEQGIAMIVNTNGHYEMKHEHAEKLGLFGYFESFDGVGAPHIEGRHTKERALQRLRSRNSLEPGQIAKIGDSFIDVTAAKNEGAYAIGFVNELDPEKAKRKAAMLRAAGADALIHGNFLNIKEILSLLSRSELRRSHLALQNDDVSAAVPGTSKLLPMIVDHRRLPEDWSDFNFVFDWVRDHPGIAYTLALETNHTMPSSEIKAAVHRHILKRHGALPENFKIVIVQSESDLMRYVKKTSPKNKQKLGFLTAHSILAEKIGYVRNLLRVYTDAGGEHQNASLIILGEKILEEPSFEMMLRSHDARELSAGYWYHFLAKARTSQLIKTQA